MKKIKIVSPAKSIESSKIEFAKGYLRSKGFEVEVGEFASGEHHYFSGTDAERLSDMQQALDDESLDVILCSRGGYGSVRIIDQMDFTKFLKNPKLVIGYSDITVFHNRMNLMGQLSVHATCPLNFEENTEQALSSLLNVLNEKQNNYQIPAYSLNKPGLAEAEIVGGNLSILYSLIGTNDDLETKGKILFIEDIGEAIYSIDRMMWALKKSGKLSALAGLVVGGMTNLKDSEIPYGKSADEVIFEAVQEYNFPLAFHFPAGHINDNRAIVFGKKASLNVSEKGAIFIQ